MAQLPFGIVTAEKNIMSLFKNFIRSMSSSSGRIREDGSLDVLAQSMSDLLSDGKNIVTSFINGKTGAGLTSAQIQANEFSAQQAQANRDWQSQMSNTEYQRGVADMKAAGLNPALMYGSGAVGASVGSGSSASSVSPGNLAPMSEFFQLLAMKKQLHLLDVQADNVEADTKDKEAEAGLKQKNLSVFDDLTKAQLDSIYAEIARKDVQNRLDEQGISESEARESLALNQAILAATDAETRKALNDANIALINAESALAEQKTKESQAAVDECRARIQNLYYDNLVKVQQANVLGEEWRNKIVERESTHLDVKQKEFKVSKQKSDRLINNVTKIGATIAGAAAAGAKIF